MGLEDYEQPQQGPDGLQHLFREQVYQPGDRVSLAQEDHLATATCSHLHSPMYVLPPFPSPAAQITGHGREAAAGRLTQRSLDPTLDFIRTSDCPRVPKPVGSLQSALVEPPELEWVATPQT